MIGYTASAFRALRIQLKVRRVPDGRAGWPSSTKTAPTALGSPSTAWAKSVRGVRSRAARAAPVIVIREADIVVKQLQPIDLIDHLSRAAFPSPVSDS